MVNATKIILKNLKRQGNFGTKNGKFGRLVGDSGRIGKRLQP